MPWRSTKGAPEWVRELGEEKARQWISVANRVLEETGDEGRAIAAASAVVRGRKKVSVYLPISKVDEDRRMVWGYASTDELDGQGDRISLGALREALPEYMKFGNIREMHQQSAVGKAVSAFVDEIGMYIGAHVVDDAAWRKVREKVYNGFSVGGRVTRREDEWILGLDLGEISLVDRPANPSAIYDVWKGEAMTIEELRKAQEEQTAALKAAFEAGFKSLVEAIAKAVVPPKAGDPPPKDPSKVDPTSDAAERLEMQAKVDALQKKVDDADARQMAEAKKRVLDAACAAGKIKAAERKAWEKDYEENPAMVERVLKGMPAVVPIGERRGVGTDGDDKGALEKSYDVVMAKAKEIVEQDKVPMHVAIERACKIVAKRDPGLWEARTKESLRQASPFGAGFAPPQGEGFGD